MASAMLSMTALRIDSREANSLLIDQSLDCQPQVAGQSRQELGRLLVNRLDATREKTSNTIVGWFFGLTGDSHAGFEAGIGCSGGAFGNYHRARQIGNPDR